METIKVILTLCVSALPSMETMDSQVKAFRESYPSSRVTVSYQLCEKNGKSIKGRKVVYSQ